MGSTCRVCMAENKVLDPNYQACPDCIRECLDLFDRVSPWSYYHLVVSIAKKRTFNVLSNLGELTHSNRTHVSRLTQELDVLTHAIFLNPDMSAREEKTQLLRDITEFKEAVSHVALGNPIEQIYAFKH